MASGLGLTKRKSTKRGSKAPANTKPGLSVLDFFNVATSRMDGWNDLNNATATLRNAKAHGRDTEELAESVEALLARKEVYESFWAYPGTALFADVVNLYKDGDYQALAHAVDRITRALMSDSYRRSPAAWSLSDAITDDTVHMPDYYDHRDASRPFFELLIVDDNRSPQEQKRIREELKTLRRPEDPFIYEPVFVASFEDAIAATIINHNAQAVVIYDYFPFESRHDMPDLRDRIERYVQHDPDTLAPESYGTALAASICALRPELNIFLMTDRRVEHLAGTATAAHIRRVFYDVEELNELHLSILEGVGDRYRTPYFSNLEKFSRRPIGTFHALPIARGKSIFKSHWIKDMGHFYGTNLFLAESSTTAGGLDSLLEPKGTIKQAHELAARCFGSAHSYFCTNGTSTANKIVGSSPRSAG